MFPLLEALRPRQWVKNLLLFAGLLFTFDVPHSVNDYLHALLGFALFCLLSGCAYLVNDIRDVAADRLHPVKKNRPIASGRLSVSVATLFVVCAAPLTLLLGWRLLGTAFFITMTAYLALTLSYSWGLKKIVIVDVMAVATGFVLRAVAGAAALPVMASEWLLLCTFLLALFIALMKRRAEIVALGQNAPTRSILAEYSQEFLEQLATLTATTCLIAYLLYTVLSPTGRNHPYLIATSLFVLYGIFRYLYLTYRQGLGEAPEVVLRHDRPLQIAVILWVLAVIVALQFRNVPTGTPHTASRSYSCFRILT
ncbi:MAG: decaprenyl-phosphate phosphoribosyltransferase [bacterium]|jgi:4-hydroxybenzoate polyprenyltransferase